MSEVGQILISAKSFDRFKVFNNYKFDFYFLFILLQDTILDLIIWIWFQNKTMPGFGFGFVFKSIIGFGPNLKPENK